jgi:hypothetical protein
MSFRAVLLAVGLEVASGVGDEVWVAPAGATASPGLICRVTSAAPVARRVRVEAFAADGATVFDSGRFALAPDAVFQSGVGAAGHVCRFELEDGRDLRAEALVFDAAAERFTPIPARRARPLE